jgi:hypothetical protein
VLPFVTFTKISITICSTQVKSLENLLICDDGILVRCVFYLKHDVSETGLSPSSGRTCSVGPNRHSWSLSLSLSLSLSFGDRAYLSIYIKM